MTLNFLNNTPSYFLSFCLTLIVANALAQTPLSRSFESLSINDGLSQGFVSSILQDNSGLMWFTTGDGLNKYDGNTFTVYHHDPNDSTSIGSDDLTCIFEDSKQRLWIGTRNKGLDFFDRENNVFVHIRHTNFKGLRSDTVLGITEDKNGALWIRTKKGVNRLEIVNSKSPLQNASGHELIKNATFLFTPIRLDSAFEAGKDKYGPEKIFVDSRNQIFLTTNNSLWELKYHTRNHTYELTKRYSYAVKDSTMVPDILEDTIQHCLLLNKGEIIQFPDFNFEAAKEIYRYEPSPISWTLDKKEGLWIADGDKYTRLDLKSGQKQHVLPVDPLQIPIINTTTAFYTDRTGVVWIASGGYGILKYDPENETFHHIMPQFYAYQLLESKAGKIVTNAFQEITIDKNEPVSIDTLIDVEIIKKNFPSLA